MALGSRTPGFSPPHWVRFGRRPNFTPAVGGLPLPPLQIPICWLSNPVRLRMEQPVNYATVTQEGGTEARSRDTDSIDEYGQFPFTATLQTATNADPANLAHWTVTHKAEPRTRSPELVIDLLYRSDAEQQLIVEVQRGRRIQLTGVPPQFPEGAHSLIISGVTHQRGVSIRRVKWTTSAVVGTVPGVPGPWFRLGSSSLGGSDIVLF